MTRDRIGFLFLNLGHFFDHLIILVFATSAALVLVHEWNIPYPELIPYATPGLIAFGVGALPAGWIADKWSREAMMVVFFLGLGAAGTATALADSPLQIGIGLFLIGLFASIYHPVGLALVVEGRRRTGMPLAINGVFGNMGVACAALLTGWLIDAVGWRAAFAVPGTLCFALGCAYAIFLYGGRRRPPDLSPHQPHGKGDPARTIGLDRRTLVRVFGVVFFTTALGGLIFQSTTFALPKVFEERLSDLAGTNTLIGWYAFLAFAVAALAQLVVGHLVDNYSIRTVFACIAALQAVLFGVMQHLTGAAALLVAVCFMLAVFGQIPINDVLIGRATSSAWRSRAYSIRFVITFAVAATAVPMIAFIRARWDFAALFLVLALAASAIFVAALLLPGTGTPSRSAAR